MPDVTAQKSNKQIIASGDYSASNPAAVTVRRGAANAIMVRVGTTLLSGAGCTVTATMTDADTGAVLGTLAVTAVGTFDKVLENLPETVHRITVTCTRSGTNTTLTYSVVVGWPHLTYKANPYWDGTAYVSSECSLP